MNNSINNPKVSIIVPIYNTQEYIGKCALSLLEQTYDNIEYIFIDDCSTDNSLTRLQEITVKFPHKNITIINNPQNSGSSATRNIGLNQATGEFINFCDSDDWVEPTMIEEMINHALHHNADVVTTPFYTNTFNKERILNFKSTDIADLNKIPLNFLHFSLCNKIIKAQHLKSNESLPNVNCWEDLSIISRIYASGAKAILLNKPFYHYRKYEYHSLTSSSHEHQLEDRLKYTDFLIKWFNSKGISKEYAQFLNHLKFTAKIKMLRTSPRQYRRWKRTYPESNKNILSYKDIPFHYRILFILAKYIIRG